MDITGTVLYIGETQVVSDKFQKREVAIEYCESNPQYKEQLIFEAVQDKVDILDSVSVGDTVEVGFNLRGRGFTKKDGSTGYFNTLQLWKIKKSDGTPSYSAPSDLNANPGEDDDLPF